MGAERLARSGSYSLIGSSFAAIAALVLAVLVGNALGAYNTGLFFQALAIFTIVSQVLRLGTNSAMVRFVSEQRAFGRVGEAWRTVAIGLVPVVIVSIVIAAAVAVFAPQIATWLASPAEQDDLAALLRDMAPYFLVASALAVLTTAMRMMRGIVAFTLVQSILLPASRLIAVAIAIALSWAALETFRAWMAVLPLWLVIAAAILVRPLVVDWRQRARASESARSAAGRFWAFSGTRAVGGTLETMLEWSDVLIVAAVASPTEAGIYAVATRAIRAGQVVDRAMRLAASPTISQMLALSDVSSARDLHTSVTRAMVLSTWPFYLVLATLGPAVLGLFGPEFVDGAIVLSILAAPMMISSASGMLQSVLLQGGRSSWQVYNKTLVLAISIGGNLLLVPTLGILGAALVWSACVLVDTGLAAWQVHRGMRVSLEPRKLVLAMSIPLIVFGIGGLVLRLSVGATVPVLVIGVPALAVVYLAVLWALRVRLGIVSLWREVPVIGRYVSRSAAQRDVPNRADKAT